MLWTGLAWGIAVVLALVVLGYCGYEIAWKTKRLRRDLAALESMRATLDSLQRGVAEAAARVEAQRSLLRRPGA